MLRIRTPWRAFLGVSLAALTLSCGAGPKPEPGVPEGPPPMPKAEPAQPAPQGAPLLSASVLAQLDDENAASYFARRGDDGLLLYASAGRWLTRQVDADGNPRAAAPIDAGPLAGAGSMASLRPVGDGYLAVWSELVAKNHAIKILALDKEGKAAGPPTLVTQVADDVKWVDVLPNARGALVLWEIAHEDRSDVLVVPVAGGKVEGSPSTVVQGAIGWEAEATERGAAIATVMSDVPPAPGSRGPRRPARTAEEAAPRAGRLGKVVITEIDTKGRASPPVVVSPEVTAEIDVTLAEVGGKYVIAWTDERNIDAAVFVATVDPGGKIAVPPHRATPPFGEQALVSLVAESYAPAAPRSKRALLAWEDQLRVQRDGRLIHLATLGADGQIGRERAVLVFSASGPPDIEPDGEGFAALTLAPVHDMPAGVDARSSEGAKPEAPVWPAFVRFGPDLTVVASEPVRSDAFGAGDKVPYITRALTCRSGKCMSLGIGTSASPREASSPPAPAPLALVSLPVREGPWKAPAYREADEGPPRPTSVVALFDGDHMAKVAATDLPVFVGGSADAASASAPKPPGGALVAWVTYFLQVKGTPGGKGGKSALTEDPVASATLGVRGIGAGGAPGKPVTLATNALSIGGVSLAPAPAREGKKPEAALGWVAAGRGEPQVMVTRLGPDGEKLAQKAVTTTLRKKSFSVVVEIPSSTSYNYGTYKQITVATSPLSNPGALTVDSFGNLFVVDKGNNRVLREASPSSGNLSESVVGTSTLSTPGGVATTFTGNVYISDSGNSRVIEEDLSDPPSLTFSAQSSATSYPQIVTLENVGSATLNLLPPASGLNPALSDLTNFSLTTTGSTACPSVASTSKSNGTLAPNATCQLPLAFTPTSVGSFTATVGITDNNLGAPSATQTIKLTGTSTPDVEAIFWAPVTSIFYGTALTNLLNAYAYDGSVSSIPGTIAYTATLAGSSPVAVTGSTLLVPGSYVLTATFTPTNTTTYTTLTATSPLSVAPGQPTIAWSSATYTLVTPTPLGTNLPSAATFNGTAVAGTFSYSAKNTTTGTSTAVTSATVLPLGTYTVTATFTPQSPALYATVAASATVSEVLPTPTLTWANPMPAPIPYGTPLGSILNVTAAYGTTNVPGTAVYSIGTLPITSATILTGGSYTLTATFTPTNSASYLVATSTISLTVTQIASTAITLTATTLTATMLNPDGLAATVVGPYATPTGSVQFLLATTGNPIVLGTGTLGASGVVTCYTSSGSNASCSALIGLPAGTDSVTAVYSGDNNYMPITSTKVSILVQDFSLVPVQATQPLPPYGLATYTFNFTPLYGTTFPAGVTWTLTGAPTGATVTVTPTTFAAGSPAATVTITVSELPIAELKGPQLFGRRLPVSVCVLLLPFAVGMRRSLRRRGSMKLLSTLLLLVLAGGCFAGLSGCGTSVNTSAASQYYLTLTGAAGNLSHGATVNLNVLTN